LTLFFILMNIKRFTHWLSQTVKLRFLMLLNHSFQILSPEAALTGPVPAEFRLPRISPAERPEVASIRSPDQELTFPDRRTSRRTPVLFLSQNFGSLFLNLYFLSLNYAQTVT
jgi:hypothetical protein